MGGGGPGRRRCATDAPGVDRATRGFRSRGSAATTSTAIHVMTTGLNHRRRAAVSMSLPVASSDPVEQLDRVVDAFHRVNRTLPKTVLSREELIALGGLVTQISGALLTLTDLLSAPAHHYDRTRLRRVDTDAVVAPRLRGAVSLLRDCRDGFRAAYTAARAFHADLRRCPQNRAHCDSGGMSSERKLST